LSPGVQGKWGKIGKSKIWHCIWYTVYGAGGQYRISAAEEKGGGRRGRKKK
jgi:hypothetical protein